MDQFRGDSGASTATRRSGLLFLLAGVMTGVTGTVGLERGVMGYAFTALGGVGLIVLGVANLLASPAPRSAGILRQVSLFVLCLSLVGLLVSVAISR